MRSSPCVLALLTLTASAAHAEPLVGLAVGNADLLLTEGARLYNEKAFEESRASFLKAARAAPANPAVYLSLARAHFAVKEVELACQAYRVFLKAAPPTPDRDKAQGELELCERQLAATPRPPGAPSVGQGWVAGKAFFFEALEKGVLLGAGSAAERLQTLLAASYAAPDLGEMAGKLAKAAEATAEEIRKAALAHRVVSPDDLRRSAALYRLALDCGATPAAHQARAAFAEGMAELLERRFPQAEAFFADAAARDPADTEARFRRGLARYLAGDKAAALRSLGSDLPNDPRTAVLRAAAAFDAGAAPAAVELQRLLYARRFKTAP